MNILGCLDRPPAGNTGSMARKFRRYRPISGRWSATAKSGSCSRASICCRAPRAGSGDDAADIHRPTSVRTRRPRSGPSELLSVGLAIEWIMSPRSFPAASSSAWPSRGPDQPSAAAVRRRADRQPRLQDQQGNPADVPAVNGEEKITIILVTHDANVATTAKRRIKISDGLIESGAGERDSSAGRSCDNA